MIESQPFSLMSFLENYLQAKKGSRVKRKLDGLLKKRIYQLMGEHRDCCGQKIKKYLRQDYGVDHFGNHHLQGFRRKISTEE